MENKTELQEFIEIVDCKEIQDNFSDIELNSCSRHFCDVIGIERNLSGTFGNVSRSEGICQADKDCTDDNWLYLPTLDQLIEMLGDKFYSLYFDYINKRWGCVFYTDDQFKAKSILANQTFGQSARIALARAVKEILK